MAKWGRVVYIDLCEEDHIDTERAETIGCLQMETFGYITIDDNVIRVIKEKEINERNADNIQVMVIPLDCVISVEYVTKVRKKEFKSQKKG